MEGLSQTPQGATTQGGSQGGAEDEAKRAQEEQMKRDLMATVLDTAARERRMSSDSCPC
jgi:programmed cell death protein 5